MRLHWTISVVLLLALFKQCVSNNSHINNDLNESRMDEYRVPVFIKEEHISRRESAGGYLSVNCKARGYPRVQVKWFKDGVPLTEIVRSYHQIFDIKRWDLYINNLTPSDSGNYTCVASNLEGSIKRTVNVKVIPRIVAMKPKVKDGYPGNHTVLIGQTLEMKCDIDYIDETSPPMVTWARMIQVNGSYLDDSGRGFKNTIQRCSYHNVCYQPDDQTYFIDDATVLKLFNVTEDMSGWYACQVENEMGDSVSFGYVQILKELPQDEEETWNAKVVIAGGAGGVIIFVSIVVIILTYARYINEKRKKKYAAQAFQKVYQWTKVVLIEKQKNEMSKDPLLDPRITIERKKLTQSKNDVPPETEYELQTDKEWEIDRQSLETFQTLGEGQFGRVILAKTNQQRKEVKRDEMEQEPDRGSKLEEESYRRKLPKFVAVKMLKEGHTDSEMIDLVKEMEIMKAIGSHRHIVNLIGVCTQPVGKPLWLILEYAPKGNLRDYLLSFKCQTFQNSNNNNDDLENKRIKYNDDYERPDCEEVGLDLKDMLKMSYEIASGMEFLSQNKCVHRDLAARNILVMHDLVVKIADFGLARDIRNTDYYRKSRAGHLPIRWMAPESVFEQVSTTMSDVWSYGILCYEIVTLGDSPAYQKSETIEIFLENLREGRKIGQPRNCPDNFYEVMFQCWSLHPEMRPSWRELVEVTRKLYSDAQPLIYIDMSPI